MSGWGEVVSFLPLALLVSLPFLIYWDAIWGGWVSDDCTMPDGNVKPIFIYDGKLQRPLSWHNIFKKFRYEFGKFPNPNPSWKTQNQLPFLPSPHAHHRLNIWLLTGCAGFLYSFLCRVTSTKIAFLATLLFIVHPLGCQTIAWVSGVGYVTSLFFMLVGLNLGWLILDSLWFQHPMGTVCGLLAYGFCQWMAVEAQFATVGVLVILCWLHWWPMVVVAGIVGFYQCLHTLREAVALRRKVFHEQQMAASTYFYLRKLVVMVKTIAYDFKLACFPKRLGLYHTFNYHYPFPYVEWEDGYFWMGMVLLLGLGGSILYGPSLVQLGGLWFLAYIILFSNAITANQFVVDRYVWIPSFGVCLLAAAYLPLWAYWLVVGIALMRTWGHLPTYIDEVRFYQSNMWNFPTSEVVYGNLGVTCLNRGLVGTSLETWASGIQLNPEYDVNWYNLASAFKSRGILNPNYAPFVHGVFPPGMVQEVFAKDPSRSHLHFARYCLQRAVTARTCHFPDPWRKELLQLEQELMRPAGQSPPPARLITPLLVPALT